MIDGTAADCPSCPQERLDSLAERVSRSQGQEREQFAGSEALQLPSAQIAVMGVKGAVEIIFRSDLGDAEKIAARTKEYEDRFLSPFVVAERGYIDEVITPRATRLRLARKGKKVEMPARKYDNSPCEGVLPATLARSIDSYRRYMV
jgi:hypothetical protein